MIRPYHPEDSSAVIELWLQASIQSHAFVPPSFWQAQQDMMRDIYLPQAETLVLEDQGVPVAFLSLHDERLAALFVSPLAQGRGLGRQLLGEAMRRRERLSLTVYKANVRAVAFYQKAGFATQGEQTDPHTGQAELTMCWARA